MTIRKSDTKKLPLAVALLLGGVGAVAAGFVTKRITDSVISGKIAAFVARGRDMMQKIYARFIYNLSISIVLNGIIIVCALAAWKTSGAYPAAKTPLLLAASCISFFMMLRACINFLRALRSIYPHRKIIQKAIACFLKKFFLCPPSFSFAIKQTITMIFEELYNQHTNDFVKGAHKAGAFLGVVKSQGEIGDEVVDKFYRLIRDFILPYLVYRVAALTVFYGTFIFLLRPLVFSATIAIKFYEILLYPLFIFKRIEPLSKLG